MAGRSDALGDADIGDFSVECIGGAAAGEALAADTAVIGDAIAAEADAQAAAAAETETAASEGTEGAAQVRAGRAAEKAVDDEYAIGPKHSFKVGGRTRIADGWNDHALSEVKNVKYQAYTQQLKDSLEEARRTGRSFDLYVRGGANATKLSKPLRDAIDDPYNNFDLKYIP